MAKLSFAEQIKHPNWQKRRLEVMEAAGFCCERCGTNEVTLNVHHKRYVKGRMYWDYPDNELQCLCEDCHKEEHAHRELLERILLEADECTGGAWGTAAALIAGYFAGEVAIAGEVEKAAIELDGHTYELGLLASMAGGASWKKMAAAAEAVCPRSLSPSQQRALDRWQGKD